MSSEGVGTGRIPRWRLLPACGLVVAGALLVPWRLPASQGEAEPVRGPEVEVIVQREAVQLLDVNAFRVPLSLAPAKAVELIAPADGVVRVVSVKAGSRLRDKTEAVRLDDSREQLVIKRAAALLKGAQQEKKSAQAKGDSEQLALAEARVEATQAELDLAHFDAGRMTVVAPFSGEVERVYVVEGEFVRAGQKLARLIDATTLKVEAPIDRTTGTVGVQVEVAVEGANVQGRVEAVLPLEPRFEAVREIIPSPAVGILVVENGTGRLRPGQTVLSPYLPHDPVTAVSAAAVTNLPDGRRKVQVLRDNVVRNLTVQVHGRAGGDQVYVSGRFGAADEVIVSTTRELADGTPLRALIAGAGTKPARTAGDKKKKSTASNSGF